MLPFITGGPKNHESKDEGEGKMAHKHLFYSFLL